MITANDARVMQAEGKSHRKLQTVLGKIEGYIKEACQQGYGYRDIVLVQDGNWVEFDDDGKPRVSYLGNELVQCLKAAGFRVDTDLRMVNNSMPIQYQLVLSVSWAHPVGSGDNVTSIARD